TAGDAIAAADAVLFLKVDDAVGVLHDRARRRTSLEASGVFAVHTAVLANQPLKIALGVFVLGEAHQRPGVLRQIVRVVIVARESADLIAQIVPFHARHLAGL